MPPILRFASWVGGDMDGNPNVDATTLLATLERHRQLILDLYLPEVRRLARRLSQSTSRVSTDVAVDRRIADYAERYPEAMAAVPARHRQMPYRVLLSLVAARLEATRAGAAGAYREAADFAADLRRIAASLEGNRGRQAGLFRVRRLLRRVDCFGFHLAALDVRQDALVHRRVVGRLLGDPEWLSRSAEQRQRRLRSALDEGAEPSAEPDEEGRRTLAVFAALAEGRRRHGGVALGPFIISMTQGADDVLAVLLLARWGGLGGKGGRVPLDVAPLLETVGDLEAAPEILRALLSDAAYRRHLAGRERRQVVMIGYSDSNKDGGLAASRWALQQTQGAVAAALEEAGVRLTVFHGRGGTISRGGGKAHRAILAAPPAAVAGRLRSTEQGEAIDRNFGLRAIALRHLERLAGATALATVGSPEAALPAEWSGIMDEIAADSRAAYRELVYGSPEFVDYFRRATPIDVIERMRIGSRPAARRSGQGLDNLRAIPWVFAWTQSRHLLPGWYGLGSGLAAAAERYGSERLIEMARSWRFFATLLEDVEMVLGKSDLAIAERYARLAGEAGAPIFARIRSEYELTVEMVLAITGAEALLDRDPALQRSILLRNPYVDPMSLLQVDLLERWRETDRTDEELLRALLATVHGIAGALQNTG